MIERDNFAHKTDCSGKFWRQEKVPEGLGKFALSVIITIDCIVPKKMASLTQKNMTKYLHTEICTFVDTQKRMDMHMRYAMERACLCVHANPQLTHISVRYSSIHRRGAGSNIWGGISPPPPCLTTLSKHPPPLVPPCFIRSSSQGALFCMRF